MMQVSLFRLKESLVGMVAVKPLLTEITLGWAESTLPYSMTVLIVTCAMSATINNILAKLSVDFLRAHSSNYTFLSFGHSTTRTLSVSSVPQSPGVLLVHPKSENLFQKAAAAHCCGS